ncbi:MAG TPA: hypothetical protein VH144_02460 [Candidatus Saccharimonadales bacterium]|nr:hypothetical protein [Candidatus Saccharimonadales bacterium]
MPENVFDAFDHYSAEEAKRRQRQAEIDEQNRQAYQAKRAIDRLEGRQNVAGFVEIMLRYTVEPTQLYFYQTAWEVHWFAPSKASLVVQSHAFRAWCIRFRFVSNLSEYNDDDVSDYWYVIEDGRVVVARRGQRDEPIKGFGLVRGNTSLMISDLSPIDYAEFADADKVAKAALATRNGSLPSWEE